MVNGRFGPILTCGNGTQRQNAAVDLMAATSPLYQMLPCSISQVQKIQLVALSPLRTLAMTHEAAVRPVIAALRS
jgi:hypothetical protein